MTTATKSQAAEVAVLLTKASEALLDAHVALCDVLEIANNPDGVRVPQQEALALVGMNAVARRHAGWVNESLTEVERRSCSLKTTTRAKEATMPAEAITKRTTADLRAALEELLKLAVDVAAIESRLEEAAKRADWEHLVDESPFKFSGAVRAEIMDALHDASGQGKKDSGLDSCDVCQSIQDAIDVLEFAMEREREDGPADA